MIGYTLAHRWVPYNRSNNQKIPSSTDNKYNRAQSNQKPFENRRKYVRFNVLHVILIWQAVDISTIYFSGKIPASILDSVRKISNHDSPLPGNGLTD